MWVRSHKCATIQDKLVKTVVANYVLWPGAHFINFKFVPSQHRILYNNCVSVRPASVRSSLSIHSAYDSWAKAGQPVRQQCCVLYLNKKPALLLFLRAAQALCITVSSDTSLGYV